MKTIGKIMLLPLCLLMLLSGCGYPDGDFWGTKAIISVKEQNSFDKEKKQARYTIQFNGRKYTSIILIMPENFGEVGDVIVAENKTLKTAPMLENSNQ